MPLVINSLGGGHTHTNTHTYRHPHRNNFKKPGAHWPKADVPGLTSSTTFQSIYMALAIDIMGGYDMSDEVRCEYFPMETKMMPY